MTHARWKGRLLPLAFSAASLLLLAVMAWPELARGPHLGVGSLAALERAATAVPGAQAMAVIQRPVSAPTAADVASADPDPPPDPESEHPHPITARHQRIFRENELIAALNGALDVRDAAGFRRLLDDYRREFPEDPSQLSAGYQVIADCLEQLDAASRARAQRYFDEERGSTLRRMVARVCLTP